MGEGSTLMGEMRPELYFKITIPFAIPEGALISVGPIHPTRKSRSMAHRVNTP
jgi:hypothetical protein